MNNQQTIIYNENDIIESAFEYFRKKGFPYPDLPIHICMQEINKLANTPMDKLIRTNTAYNVADTYHKHRFECHAINMKSPLEAFQDDKTLKKTLYLTYKYNKNIPDGKLGKLSIINGTQACSNFRPGFACYIYKTYCKPHDIVLDTSTGFGGRLIGFVASNINGKYIGIDPSKRTHLANIKMATDLKFIDKVELYNSAVEDLDEKLLHEKCDFAFTSPPYFCKEYYSDEDNQSHNRYKTFDEWINGFLKPMIKFQYNSLKNNSFNIINIADVKIKNKIYSLKDITISLASEIGFQFIKEEIFPLQKRMGVNTDSISVEPILIFKKY